MRLIASCLIMMCWAGGLLAGSLFDDPGERKPVIDTSARGSLLHSSGASERGAGASLFAGDARGGFFAPLVRQAAVFRDSGVAGLKNLIAKAEAGSAQYDAVVFSARIKPPRRPTQMSVAEIYQWIEQTPGQNHAIGRYQFIPKTLRALVKRAGVETSAQFSPELQDQLAMHLLEDAGLSRFLAGDISQTQFMNGLARIWAGLPNSSGKSHYHGFAGNKAVITWATFREAMDRYFPQHS